MKQSQSSFHIPGRFGDAIYQLYTIKALGGGKVFVSDYHYPSWGPSHIASLLPLLRYQSYISQADMVQFSVDTTLLWREADMVPSWITENITHDLHRAERDNNPEQFPEWDGRVWPGNIHIAKRYAVHFGVEWCRESAWLEAPLSDEGDGYDIVFHAPKRRLVRDPEAWKIILEVLAQKHTVLVVGGDNDIGEWVDVKGADKTVPSSFLETAQHINSSKLFMGAASSCNVIAEALKKDRIVELADDCHNTYPYGLTGHCVNGLHGSKIIEMAEDVISKGHQSLRLH